MRSGWRRRPWTECEHAYLRESYATTSTKAIAEKLGRPIGTVYQRAAVLGLHKSAEFLADPKSGCRLAKGTTAGSKTQFRKGGIPFNKGMRRPGWAPGRMREGQFKPGQRSGVAAKNWVPVGIIMPDSDGYLRIKVREAVAGAEPTGFGNKEAWPQLHRQVWSKHHGEIPAGYIVTFKDKDKTNCALDNLELISMADNARRNSMWGRYPKELIQVIHLKGQLKRRIREKYGDT